MNTKMIFAGTINDRIEYVNIVNNKKARIYAKCFIDCTGDIVLARNCGCSHNSGEESSKKYNEMSAPYRSSNIVKGVSLIFRVSKS